MNGNTPGPESRLQRGVLGFCRGFLAVTAGLALIVGAGAWLLRPAVTKAWSSDFARIGLGELGYAAAALLVTAILGWLFPGRAREHEEPRPRNRGTALDLSSLELRILGIARVFLTITGVLALFTGVFALTLGPVLPKGWASMSLPFGIAELVYAGIVLVILLVARQFFTRRGREHDGESQGAAGTGAGAQEQSLAEKLGPDFPTVVAFVGKLFGVLLIAGVVVTAFYGSGMASSQVASFWSKFGGMVGTGLLAGLGFFAVGALFGFLFGLPKSGYRSHPDQSGGDVQAPDAGDGGRDKGNGQGDGPASDKVAAAHEAGQNAAHLHNGNPAPPSGGRRATDNAAQIPNDNTNLEEVSDWLTKIIVGLGLVELKQLPIYLRTLAAFFGKLSGDEKSGDLFLMLAIFFLIVGFISSYVMTRLYLKILFAQTNKYLSNRQVQVILRGAEQARQDAKESMQTAEAVKKEATETGVIARVNEARVLIARYSDSEEGLTRALAFIDQALKTSPGYVVALVEKGRALKRLWLLRRDPALLQQAVDAVSRAREISADKFAPAVYNAACYKALEGKTWDEIRDDLKKAFELNPSLKATAPTDGDLKQFWENTEFKALTKTEEEPPAPVGKAETPPPAAGGSGSPVPAKRTENQPGSKPEGGQEAAKDKPKPERGSGGVF